MSRTATSTEIIEKGEYLDPQFDSNTLTVPHLLSILTLHSVRYPTPYNKAKLVQTFNEHIKPRANQFKNERLKKESSLASSHDITDGLTGASLSEVEVAQQPPAPARRTSRRLSRPPSQEPAPVKPDPPKRRRSSAGPTLSRTPVKKAREPQEPILVEESEPDDQPVKKVGRPRKSVAAAGPQGRRVSQPDDMEGWSDYNIFQSGAESSSPIRAPANIGVVTTRRPTRRGRTSMSAPPQVPSSSPFSAPSTAFEPQLPPALKLPRSPVSSPLRAMTKKAAEKRGTDNFSAASPLMEDEEDLGELVDEDSPEALVEKVSAALANGGSGRAINYTAEEITPSSPIWTRVLTMVTFVVLLGISIQYKMSSAAIGYCYSGSDTNSIIEARKARMLTAEECHRKSEIGNTSETDIGNDETCPSLALLPFLEPLRCTPCPLHAFCTEDVVNCEQGFLLKQHPLEQIPLLASLLNGSPGFGPIAFPPRCVEDTQRKSKIGRLGIALENYLAAIHGQRKCTTPSGPSDSAALWGVKLETVHDNLRKGTVVKKKLVNTEEFESLFEQAVADLDQYGFIMLEDTVDGKFIASKRAAMNLGCKIRVQFRDLWRVWRRFVLGSAFALVFLLYLQRQIIRRQAESRRIRELAQIALDTLRNQELAHYTDPVSTPQPYLPSIHLRDLVLQAEHSLPARRKLWDKVERIVEGNSNVRATMEELEGGDEGKVWKWIGGSRAIRSPEH